MSGRTVILLFIVFLAMAAGMGAYLWDGVTGEPEIDVVGVGYRVDEKITVLGIDVPKSVTFLVDLEAYNPNILAVKVLGGEYTVFVGDVEVGQGSIPEVEIPADSRIPVETEVKVSALEGLKGVMGSLKEGTLTVKVVGEAEVGVPILGTQKLSFTKEKSITI